MTGDYFAEHKPDQGMDLCLAVAVLPEGAALVHGELSPNALPQSGLAEFLDQVQTLPHPPVRGGPVALVVRFPVMGGRQDRLKAGLRNNVPAGFISVLKRAESYFAARLPRPGFWARTIAGCRRCSPRCVMPCRRPRLQSRRPEMTSVSRKKTARSSD